RLKKLQKQLDQKEEQLSNAKKHLSGIEAQLADAGNLTPADLEKLSKEHSAATDTASTVGAECDELLEEIINLEE
ncbi:MAG TPA: hypothetical protein DCY51_06480, partial [Bacteroidetes bacterium]|nr:hypothetical protein [Bacteroidota bacterium]